MTTDPDIELNEILERYCGEEVTPELGHRIIVAFRQWERATGQAPIDLYIWHHPDGEVIAEDAPPLEYDVRRGYRLLVAETRFGPN